jgi:putative flavoprotein involved in K+ transport
LDGSKSEGIPSEALLHAGIQRVPRVIDVNNGKPVLENGRVFDVANVIWATGFVRDYRWIKLPVFDAKGHPIHHRGVVLGEPGLYFVGLPFQSSLLSGLVAGAGADAKYIVKQITERARGLTFRVEERLAS